MKTLNVEKSTADTPEALNHNGTGGTEEAFKIKIGFFVIWSHVLVVFLLLWLYSTNGFLFSELTTVIGILIPVFSTYTTAILRYSINSRNARKRAKVNVVSKNFRINSWLITGSFVAYVYTIILMKSYNVGFNNFEEFKGMLMASEGLFGVYLMQIYTPLFSGK